MDFRYRVVSYRFYRGWTNGSFPGKAPHKLPVSFRPFPAVRSQMLVSVFHPKRTLDVRQTRSLGPVPPAFRDWFAAPLPLRPQARGVVSATQLSTDPAIKPERTPGRPADCSFP